MGHNCVHDDVVANIGDVVANIGDVVANTGNTVDIDY
jgi:hypothetical protein